MPNLALVKMKKITVHQQSVVDLDTFRLKKISNLVTMTLQEFVLGNGMSRTVQVMYSILVKLQVC